MAKRMFDGAPLTRREVLIAREAFGEAVHKYGVHTPSDVRALARRTYPLPPVTRPRVVKDCHSDLGYDQLWRCVDGTLQWLSRPHATEWNILTARSAKHKTVEAATLERIRLWADLINHPTETVEDEEGTE